MVPVHFGNIKDNLNAGSRFEESIFIFNDTKVETNVDNTYMLTHTHTLIKRR